jgi:hypothetical protein
MKSITLKMTSPDNERQTPVFYFAISPSVSLIAILVTIHKGSLIGYDKMI